MKRVLTILLPLLIVISCKNKTNNLKPSFKQKKEDSTQSTEENKIESDGESEVKSTRINLHETKHKEVQRSQKKSNGNYSSEDAKNNHSTISQPELVELSESERKPPLVKQTITWSEGSVSIFYSKKVYPDPNVGCTASDEVFSIKIPVAEQEEKKIFGTADFQKSEFKYKYSGGLYGETSTGKPSSGIIKLNQINKDKWEVEINLEFPIAEHGGMESQERTESFEVSGIFH